MKTAQLSPMIAYVCGSRNVPEPSAENTEKNIVINAITISTWYSAKLPKTVSGPRYAVKTKKSVKKSPIESRSADAMIGHAHVRQGCADADQPDPGGTLVQSAPRNVSSCTGAIVFVAGKYSIFEG